MRQRRGGGMNQSWDGCLGGAGRPAHGAVKRENGKLKDQVSAGDRVCSPAGKAKNKSL